MREFLPDGSLAFSFTDGWANEARARVLPEWQGGPGYNPVSRHADESNL